MAMMDNVAMLKAIQSGVNTTDQLTLGLTLYEHQRTLNQINDLRVMEYISVQTKAVRGGEKVFYVVTEKGEAFMKESQ